MGPGLTVLFTNTQLRQRGGTELFIRDVAVGLLRRGHTPIVYSPQLGDVAAEIRAATVPVVDSLGALGVSPDLIHGQHHLETMAALLHFPDTPAISFSHGWLPWQEAPPRFPRILQYAAVSRAIRDRLVHEHAIDPERVTIVHNFVDLNRFHLRAALPARPARALLYGNAATSQYHQVVAAACAERGIALDVAGAAFEAVTDQPERLLPGYDLVFAMGRSAIESMATGAAVILAGAEGVGPLVTSSNLPDLQELNFGLRALHQPCTTAHVAAAIAGYDAADALAVARRLRQTAGLDRALDRILSLYGETLARWRAAPRDPAAEQRAAAAYLDWLSRGYVRGLGEDHQRQTALAAQLRDQCAGLQRELQAREAELAAARAENRAMRETPAWRVLERWWRVKRLVGSR